MVKSCIDSGGDEKTDIGLKGCIQVENGSLAAAISSYWLSKRAASINNNEFDPRKWMDEYGRRNEAHPDGTSWTIQRMQIDANMRKGLTDCRWPGRNQIIECPSRACTFYLDGAHTVESITQFVDWFQEQKANKATHDKDRTVLLFNYTGERDPETFLNSLMVTELIALTHSIM